MNRLEMTWKGVWGMARSKRKPVETNTKEENKKGKVIPLTSAIKSRKKQKVNNEEGNKTLFFLAFGGLMLLLFYPPFFRGLFFPVEQRWTLLFAAVLFFLTYLWKLSRREVAFLNHPLDFAAAALVVVYILAAVKPASRSLAVAEGAKVFLYFLTYWLVSRLGGQRRSLYLLNTMYLAAAGTALAALFSATEIVYIKDGFVGGRFYSTLQYPNALASYVGAGSLIGFYLWGQSDSRRRYLYAAANYLLLMVFLGTGSRGALLVFPGAVLLYWLLAPKGYRLNTLAHIAVSGGAALFGIARFIPLAVAKAYGPAWGWFILGLVVALSGQLVIQGTGRILFTARARWVAGIALLVLFLGGGFILVQRQMSVSPAAVEGQTSSLLARILPPQIMNRLQDINLETKSSKERLLWTKDAIKMVRERPLLGFGGGGWEAAYRQYQSYFYNSTQVHNDYAQVAVETGLTGLGVLALIWLFFLQAALANYRTLNGKERLQVAAVATAALNLGLHAALDFDLALGAISIMLWACFGLIRNMEEQRLGQETVMAAVEWKNKRAAYVTGAGFLTLILILFSVSYLAGVNSARRAAVALQRNNLNAAASYLEEAGRYDPFTASYNSDLAGILLQQGKNKEALTSALAASFKDPFNLNVLNRLAEAYWQNGALEEAIATMERARQIAPWVGAVWENLGRAYATAGINYLQAGKQDRARQMFQAAASLPDDVQEKVNTLGELKELHQQGGVALTPTLRLQAAIGQYFLGMTKEAAANLKAAAVDGQIKDEVQLWQAVLASSQGDEREASRLLAQVDKTNASLARQFDQLKKLPQLVR
ncbi:hypothetical protein MHLNE_13200 [Moorella humiferrea]